MKKKVGTGRTRVAGETGIEPIITESKSVALTVWLLPNIDCYYATIITIVVKNI